MSKTDMFRPTESTARGGDSVTAMAFYLRGNAWAGFGRLDLAIADYDAALTINPMFTPALAGRGAVWAETGDFERAIADYNVALQLNPQDDRTRTNLAIALGQKYESEARNPAVFN